MGSLVAAGVPGPVTVTKEEELKIAQEVHNIFEAKCLDCHGPELPRPTAADAEVGADQATVAFL